MNGLHSARGTEATLLSAMKQKCLQITNRIVSRVLINIRHTLFMFPLMGYFLHVSLAPQVLMGRRVQREDGSCATPGFNLRQSACLACVLGRVCLRACACTQLGASVCVRFCMKAEKVRPTRIQWNEALNLFLVCLSWEWHFKIPLEDRHFLEWILLSSFP